LFVTLWEFEVKRGSEELFEKHYGPQGAWASLFGRDPGYRGTRLLRDFARPVYVTLDFWESREAHQRFERAHAGDYDALDRECQSLTASETKIGAFEGA
jgi:heme-degrading monooxygenase HmoA